MTITTVGYREVHPLSADGRVWTGVVLLAGVSWLAVWFATVTAFFIEVDLLHLFRHRRMEREVRTLTGHTIVCGAGRTGTQVVAELLRNKSPYVAVERDEQRVAELRAAAPHLRVVQGDATRDDVLTRVNIASARGLVATLPDDAQNLFVTVAARALNSQLTIVARVDDDENVGKLERAGADHVVSPQRIGGVRMASMLLRPGLVTLLDVMTRGGGMRLTIEECAVSPGSGVVGRTLAELELPQRTGALVVAIRKAEREHGSAFLFNPQGGTRVDAGDVLMAMGDAGQIGRLRDAMGAPPPVASP